jgi:cell division transport system permease protein
VSEFQTLARRWRPAPLLPPSAGRERDLVFVMATLCFLACLTALVVMPANRAAHGWTDQLRGQATIIVRPRGAETPDSAAARAAEALAGLKGVSEVHALEKAQAQALVAPWLGDISDLDDLPVPRLVAVELDPKSPASAKSLDKALRAQGLDAVVDDHATWTKDIAKSAGVVRWVGAAIFLLIVLATATMVAFATRAGLNARRDVVEALHLIGAEDVFIARLFQSQFAWSAGLAGALGAVAAAGLGATARLLGGGAGLTPALPVAWLDLLALAPCPLAAALIAAIAARLTAETLIAGQP